MAKIEITEEALQALKAAHPNAELVSLTSQNFQAVAKIPTKAEFDMFRAKIFDEKRRASAMEALVRTCVLWPERAELNELLTNRPMLVEKWAEQLQNEGGAAEEVEVKKL